MLKSPETISNRTKLKPYYNDFCLIYGNPASNKVVTKQVKTFVVMV